MRSGVPPGGVVLGALVLPGHRRVGMDPALFHRPHQGIALRTQHDVGGGHGGQRGQQDQQPPSGAGQPQSADGCPEDRQTQQAVLQIRVHPISLRPTLVTPAPQRTYHRRVIRTIPALFAIGLAIYALVDCVRAEERLIKALPRTAWMLLIAFVPLIGPIAWLVTGRVREAGQPRRAATPPRPIAPEDDPDFMRSLEDQRRLERRRREREAEGKDLDDGDNPPAQAV